jgi:excisionase family DNA binding protein
MDTVNKEEAVKSTELSTTDLSTLYHKPILNREEASIFLGVSIRHIDNLIKRMDIPFSKSGRRTLFRRIDIDKYMESNNSQGGLINV